MSTLENDACAPAAKDENTGEQKTEEEAKDCTKGTEEPGAENKGTEREAAGQAAEETKE